MAKRQVIVPVGELYVSTDPKEELVTVLGSCVAVTLSDHENQAAGLVHIVLPGRRASRRQDDRNAYYADTGVPLLLEEMLNKGACRKNLVAGIVGGTSQCADYEEVSIGRRNAEAAVHYLKKENITILSINVGGSAGWKIIMDVATGKVSARQNLPVPAKSADANERIITGEEAGSLMQQVERMKPDPDAAGRLLNAVHYPGSTVHGFLKILSEDFVLAYHIFRMCNSAYYGRPHRISSVAGAFRLLGERQFRRICVVAGTMKHLEYSLADFGLSQKNFSSHCHATALIARCLAMHTSHSLSDDAYTAGMLHSIGMLGKALLMRGNCRNDFPGTDLNITDYECRQIAEIILTKWNIPGRIVSAVSACGNPREISSDRHSLGAMICVACEISRHLGICIGENKCNVQKIFPDALTRMGFPNGLEPVLPDILEELSFAGITLKEGCQPTRTPEGGTPNF